MTNALRDLLTHTRSIAVVGLSDKSHRDSHRVAAYMQRAGYRIIPVNPRCQEVLGEPCYARLEDLREAVDMVNCFRRSEEIPAIAESAVAIGAQSLWMQRGIVSPRGQAIAEAAGLTVVSDQCLMVVHRQLMSATEDQQPR